VERAVVYLFDAQVADEWWLIDDLTPWQQTAATTEKAYGEVQLAYRMNMR
jgi:hypothetical protein